MAVLFDGQFPVHYGYIFVLAHNAEQPDLLSARGGQVNGLCGAAHAGVLSLVTGLHTGEVPLRVEALDREPPIDPRWEDVVEASLAVGRVELTLQSFQDSVEIELPAPGSYRVRYSATGMDEAHAGDTRLAVEPELDRYLVELWPAPAAPEVVVRQGSAYAAYWHQAAGETPRPVEQAPAALDADEAARMRNLTRMSRLEE